MFGLQARQPTGSASPADEAAAAPPHFVIGFDRIAWARWVQYTLSPLSAPYLDRRNTIDVAAVVNDGLLHYGMDDQLQSLTLDIDADLVVPKALLSGTSHLHHSDLHLDSMARDAFLLLPFTHRIGVILPYEIKEDTRARVVFAAQVIDPADSQDLFRSALSLS